jgi:hypothetical protein
LESRTWRASGFFTQANNNGYTQKSMSAGGNVNLTPKLKVNAGYFHYTAEQGLNHADRMDSAYTLSGSFQINPKWATFLGV